ncbi:MAG: 3-phosphoshikimate 1-carboxyvinyltransferase [Fibrobacterales bacterium]|nr:3-phosphoshikimate 1-carboxyvinyltransferase [Fibrobacterales bacterium]
MAVFPSRIVLGPASKADGTVRLPGSKSLSNRALLAAALGEGKTVLKNLLRSDDTARMLEALSALGVGTEELPDGISVAGTGGAFRSGSPAVLDLGNAGTAMRPLCAALAASPGDWTLVGEKRMEERPIRDQVDALRSLGAEISYLKNEGFPPLRIHGKPLEGGAVRVKGSTSSQFLTALLLSAPLFGRGLEIGIDGELVSRPYVDMTLAVMERFGVSAERDGYARFRVRGKADGAGYRSPGEYFVEGDASAASYFLAAGAIAGGRVRVEGAGLESVQGDVAFADVLEKMGAEIRRGGSWIEAAPGPDGLRGADLDLNAIPDAAMTLATTALFAKGRTTIRGIGNWRVKETDRIAAMAAELRKLGAEAEEGPDYLSVLPPERIRPAEIATYNDHRMAMCFALAAFGGAPVTILDPGCVTKTFPEFFERFAEIVA